VPPKQRERQRQAAGEHVSVLSRHTNGLTRQYSVHADNLNAWCSVPGSPFANGLVLAPNHPDAEQPSVSFGPIALPDGFDTFTAFFSSETQRPHEHELEVHARCVAASGAPPGESQTRLVHGQTAVLTVPVETPPGDAVHLSIDVSFAHFAGGSVYGSVRMPYLIAYARNELTELFNRAGSDKGTETCVGEGVPHCYALEYHRILAPHRKRSFNLLEIGLEDEHKARDQPTDAPSLRVWRAFFPRATVHGYDIRDFGFMADKRTVIFQGDQGSPEDLHRFIDGSGGARFWLVVDDGSHASSHQQIALAALFPQVAPQGLYAIEDLHWQPFDETPTTLDVLRRFVEDGRIESPFIDEAAARYLEATIDRIEIRKPNDAELAILWKNAGADGNA
jgi:hypothetical protein